MAPAKLRHGPLRLRKILGPPSLNCQTYHGNSRRHKFAANCLLAELLASHACKRARGQSKSAGAKGNSILYTGVHSRQHSPKGRAELVVRDPSARARSTYITDRGSTSSEKVGGKIRQYNNGAIAPPGSRDRSRLVQRVGGTEIRKSRKRAGHVHGCLQVPIRRFGEFGVV